MVVINKIGKIKHRDRCLHTLYLLKVHLHQLLPTAKDDENYLFKDKNMKLKDKKRQIESTSSKNMASFIATVSYYNFILVSEK